MKTNSRFIGSMLLIASAVMWTNANAVTVGQIDDFEDGTESGWLEGGPSPNPPTNQAMGGPQNAEDNYLQDVSSGSPGAGGKLVMFNQSQWTGDFVAEGVQSIRMWLANEGANPLQIRIALKGGDGTWYAASTAFALPPDDVWRQAAFSLDEGDMTLIQGAADLATVLGNVTEMRILSSLEPDFRGDTIAATLGVDDIEALGPAIATDLLPVISAIGDANGNNNSDIATLLFHSGSGQNTVVVNDGGSGDNLAIATFGANLARGHTAVPDTNGDLVSEFAVLIEGSLIAGVKDVVNDTLIGTPAFNASLDPFAFLSVGDVGGGVGPDVAMLGRDPSDGTLLAQVRDVSSGAPVSDVNFGSSDLPFDAVVLDNLGGSAASEIAVLGISANGNVRAQVRDALTGNPISLVTFNKSFAPLAFAAVPDSSGNVTLLAVLGRNGNGAIQAQIKDAISGAPINNVSFSSSIDPIALVSFADSNGSGGSEIAVVGMDQLGRGRAQAKEVADGTAVSMMQFNASLAPVDAIAVNGVAGTGQNEIALLGNVAGQLRIQVKDLLTGSDAGNMTVP